MDKYTYVGPFARVWCAALNRMVEKGEEVELPAAAVTSVWEVVSSTKPEPNKASKKEGDE